MTFSIVCDCDGRSRTVGRIDDQRATAGGVTVWSATAPPRWQDRAESTIRCSECGHPAQLSAASARAVSDLLAPRIAALTHVRVTDPDGEPRVIASVGLQALVGILGNLRRLQGDT